MKFKAMGLAVVATAVLAACGGGGGSPAASGVSLTGVAATGLALAGSKVDVKCASGTGTATTDGNGAYTVTVQDGALPCIVKVTGKANGVDVTLHSVAEGTGNTATANVTPLTEMILARAAGTTPAALFDGFTASSVSSTTLAQAITDVVAVLKTALGVDLGTIDPFKAPLVAATTTPGTGNGYDQLLDQLGTKVTTAMLPLVVNQIASTTGSNAPVSLADVVANVNKGTLAGCPAALSGKYRLVEYTGAVNEVDIDFGAKKLTAGTEVVDIVPSTTQNCQFVVDQTTVVIGSSGAGAFRDPERVGYIFPVQAHRLADITGEWLFVESGIEESNQGIHFVGKMNVGANGSNTVCEYDPMGGSFASCVVDTDEASSWAEHAGGSFVLTYGSQQIPVFGFRAPNGQLSLFGSSNPDHVTAPGSFRTSFAATRQQPVPRNPVGTVTRYWDFDQTYAQPTMPNTNGTLSTSQRADTVTVTELTSTTITRRRGTDSRIDTFQLDSPITGLRYRAPASGISSVYQMYLAGDLSVSIDAMPNSHFLSISVGGRP